MFEFSRNKKNPFSVDTHFDEESPLSQQRSVPTEQQTLLIDRYLVIESHRKTSVTLWVHPFILSDSVHMYKDRLRAAYSKVEICHIYPVGFSMTFHDKSSQVLLAYFTGRQGIPAGSVL